jgi:hypothetical protein
MSDAPTILYHFRQDTAQSLARSLIVASTIQDAKGTFNLPMTRDGALALGRALEWAVAIEANHATREAALKSQAAATLERHRDAMAAQDQAIASLAGAKTDLRKSLWLSAASLVWLLLSLALWVTA